MNQQSLTAEHVERLAELADILMPATDRLPAPRNLQSYGDLLHAAFKASGLSIGELQQAIEAMPVGLDWQAAKDFAASQPAAFETLSMLASGAYVMAPEILDALGFPADRRNPAGPLEAADEYETGILEPVVSRGSFYRDPRSVGKA